MKTMIRYLYSFMIVSFLTICSCSYDSLPEGVQLELCDTTMVTYDDQAKAIIDRTCAYAGCHDAGGGAPGNFTNFEGMANFLNANKFEKRVIDQQNMPDPNDVLEEKLLTQEELDFLTCWVLQGYQEN